MSREGIDATTTRVWQACVTCRRKKIKCDGNNPCHNCDSRELECDYPGSNDNASNSRNYAAMYESRFKQLEELCQNLQIVATQLTQAIEKLPKGGCATTCSQHSACSPLECVPRNPHTHAATAGSLSASETLESACNLSADHNSQSHAPDPTAKPGGEEAEESTDANPQDDPATSAFGSLVHDSYGSLRFIGGASNEFLVQSVQSLSAVTCQEIETSPFSIGSQQEMSQLGRPKPELPFFVHGLRWRDLPCLPKPEDFNLPPKYIADMLIGLYFEHYHYTFPVLYKPHFLESYKSLYTARRGTIHDDGFLSIFFAVCACSSSLTAPEGNHASFPGLEFYEKALLLHYGTTGQATKARIQCLALISMCCAGWNTVSTSWHFAGQAVRAAQELGMHLSEYSSDEPGRDPAPSIEAESSRRIWWSIYCLDRVISTCLGRPMAANDNDCRCALPLPLSDGELEAFYNQEGTLDNHSISSSPLSGFLAFARLCQISGQVQSIQAPSEVKDLGTKTGQRRVMDLALDQEKSLDEWLKDLPEHLRSSDKVPDGGTNSEMSVQGLVIQAGTLVALYRMFVSRKHSFSQRQTIENCVTAARSCINSAGPIRDFVPPSHYLALCIHYLTISGLVLLRMTNPTDVRDDADLQQCIRILGDLEVTWSGATRGKAIIEQILRTFQENPEGESLNLDFQTLFQNPELDLTGLELSDGFFENFWGTFG